MVLQNPTTWLLKILLKLFEEKRTALVVREGYDTHRDSTFSLFTKIIEDLEK